jgi:ankyrin repeat protein
MAEPNSRELNEMLMEASRNGELDTVTALLDQNADPNVALGDGTTALSVAIRNKHFDVAKVLLSKGADPNNPPALLDSLIMYGLVDNHYPLISASVKGDFENVKVLLEQDADPNEMLPHTGRTPLMFAAEAGQLDTVIELLGKGAEINAQTTDLGYSPLMIAAQKGHVNVVKELLKKANVNATTQPTSPAWSGTSGTTALILASQLESENKDLQTRKSKIVSVLLKKGANSNAITQDRTTSLFIASQTNHVDAVGALLEADADPNTAKTDGTTALMTASARTRSSRRGADAAPGGRRAEHGEEHRTPPDRADVRVRGEPSGCGEGAARPKCKY